MALRFHLDEHVDPAIAVGLRRRAIDVTTTLEAGLGGATDEQQLAHCVQQRRVMFTQDEDFLSIAAVGAAHAGILYNKQGTKTIGQILEHLVLMDLCLSEAEMRGHVEFL